MSKRSHCRGSWQVAELQAAWQTFPRWVSSRLQPAERGRCCAGVVADTAQQKAPQNGTADGAASSVGIVCMHLFEVLGTYWAPEGAGLLLLLLLLLLLPPVGT
mmetsp:Transcript_31814/g.78514  ORF Transcript_31814/g.78514 Transcript_31814/m.78514 type:complete len:103 (+) Transcript_31814:844-1152(+)